MQAFKDKNGQAWSIDIDLQSCKTVKRDTEFDLYATVDPEQLRKLEDPQILVAVLYALCESQIVKLGMSPEQFASGFAGDVISDAAEALLRAIADFFPPRRREMLTAFVENGKRLAMEATSVLVKAANQATIGSMMPPALNDSSTKLQPSPELTLPSVG